MSLHCPALQARAVYAFAGSFVATDQDKSPLAIHKSQ